MSRFWCSGLPGPGTKTVTGEIASAAARLDKENAGYLGEAADKYEQLRPFLVRSSR